MLNGVSNIKHKVVAEMENIKRYHMEFLEKSRKKIRNGDVFVVKIKDHDLYFYGKVIDVKAQYGQCAEPILIYLYKTPTTEIIIPEDMDESDIMTILFNNNGGWREGFFKTICNIPVREEELNIDYGFESPNDGAIITKEEIENYSYNHDILYLDDGRVLAIAYVDAYNNIRDHIPKITNRYMLGFFSAISWEISEYLHNNPELKKKYGLE